uniref:Protein kinase domain-containing protein n=1 Tax=Cyclopterus lumpus TaxID=8103 RepID=A0A8C2X8W7_CYCLU
MNTRILSVVSRTYSPGTRTKTQIGITVILQVQTNPFEALKSIGLIHTDLKPDNVMFVNHKDEPFKVKLIDFGLAMPPSEVKKGMTIQPCGYRAPEVDLGLPICEAIDMWGLGCTLAFLFFGRDIFSGESAYSSMKTVCCLMGQPEDHVLNAGRYTTQFFKKEYYSPSYSAWRLKTPREFNDATGVWPSTEEWYFDTVGTLEEAVKSCSNPTDFIEREDIMAFSNLLEGLLCPDAMRRITPGQALRHDYITMYKLNFNLIEFTFSD